MWGHLPDTSTVPTTHPHFPPSYHTLPFTTILSYLALTGRALWAWRGRLWVEVPTFAPYEMEAAHLPSLLSGVEEERQLRGASNVLKSLTSNSRAIFRALAELHSEQDDDAGTLP
jgi:hypothetical protein